jgi:hypothetical protein
MTDLVVCVIAVSPLLISSPALLDSAERRLAAMTTLRQVLAVFLSALLILASSPASASAQQRHVVDPAAIASAVNQHAAKQDADRAAIRQALSRPEVKSVAKDLGLDLARADAAVSTMSGSDLERAGAAARQVNDQLAGGASSVTLSVTTIIIILLVIILLIVALK